MRPGLKFRGTFRLMLDPVFGPFIAGKFLSTSGVWIHNVVAALLAYQLTGSALVVGLVSVAQFGPQIVLLPFSGVQADRGDKQKQLVIGRLVMALGSAIPAVWIAITGVDGLPGTWPVMLGAAILGLGISTGGPALNSVLPTFVRPAELGPAIALNNVPPTIARAAGPIVGTFVALTVGFDVAFAISVVGNLAYAYILHRLPIEGRSEATTTDRRPIRSGLRHLRGDKPLMLLLLGVVAVGVGSDPALTLAPSLSERLGRGTDLVGVFVSAFGIGAGVGFFLLTLLRWWIGEKRTATVGLCLAGAGLVGLVVDGPFLLVVVCLGVTGVGMTIGLTSLSTQIQDRVPAMFRGRIMALWGVAFMGSRPFAAAFDGAVADAFSPGAAFAMVAIFVFCCAWLCRPRRILPPSGGFLSDSTP